MGEPTGPLREQLADAEARAEHLKRRIASEACATAGHDWRLIGGKNACCDVDEGDCCDCSIPVHECAGCGTRVPAALPGRKTQYFQKERSNDQR